MAGRPSTWPRVDGTVYDPANESFDPYAPLHRWVPQALPEGHVLDPWNYYHVREVPGGRPNEGRWKKPAPTDYLRPHDNPIGFNYGLRAGQAARAALNKKLGYDSFIRTPNYNAMAYYDAFPESYAETMAPLADLPRGPALEDTLLELEYPVTPETPDTPIEAQEATTAPYSTFDVDLNRGFHQANSLGNPAERAFMQSLGLSHHPADSNEDGRISAAEKTAWLGPAGTMIDAYGNPYEYSAMEAWLARQGYYPHALYDAATDTYEHLLPSDPRYGAHAI